MLSRIKILWKSYRFRSDQVKSKLVLYGPAAEYISNFTFEGTRTWKESNSSYKLVVDEVIGETVRYISYYISPTGESIIHGTFKITNRKELVKLVNTFKLIYLGEDIDSKK